LEQGTYIELKKGEQFSIQGKRNCRGAYIENGKVLEINELYHIPSKAIIAKAKKAGVKFSFGSNNVSPEVGRLEYSIQMKKECGLTSQDMYKPPVKL